MSIVNSIDLISKQEAPDADLKVIQYYFTRNLDHDRNARILFVFGEVKKKFFDFCQGTVNYTYTKTILPAVSVINRWHKVLHFRCVGFPDLLLIFKITTGKDLNDRNRQFEFKQALARSMLIKS